MKCKRTYISFIQSSSIEDNTNCMKTLAHLEIKENETEATFIKIQDELTSLGTRTAKINIKH